MILLSKKAIQSVILFEDSAAAITAPIAELASLVIGLFRGTAKLALIPAIPLSAGLVRDDTLMTWRVCMLIAEIEPSGECATGGRGVCAGGDRSATHGLGG